MFKTNHTGQMIFNVNQINTHSVLIQKNAEQMIQNYIMTNGQIAQHTQKKVSSRTHMLNLNDI